VEIMRRDYNLSLITLGTIVLGTDYLLNFIPGLSSFFSLNRFVFLAVFAADVLFFSGKYLRSTKIYLACVLIFIGCLPFLIFKGGGLREDVLTLITELLGVFAYLLFFYFNCVDSKTAGRISTVLFLTSGLIAVYVMGSQLGLVGSKMLRWRGHFQYTSASGIFDPNVITLYFLPVFAFGPLIRFRWKTISGKMMNLFVVLYISFCFAAFFQLNSRSGSLAVASCLVASLTLRYLIIPPEERGGRWNALLFIAVVIGALVYAHMQYNILGPILGVYRWTYLDTDTSFVTRVAAYDYLRKDLFSSPNLFGESYQEYWRVAGWKGFWPHCTFVDVYIKGGLLFLVTYFFLYIGSITKSFREIFTTREIALKSCFAGFFCLLVGFMPLVITLSLEGKKLPWAIIGCVFGLAAASRDKSAGEK